MSETASINPSIDEHILDELVPPPGPRWRRAVLWVTFLGIVAASVWATTSGTVIPRVSTSVDTWGGTGPVSVTTSVQNNSRVDIEVVGGPRPRPGLSSIGYTTGNPALDAQPAKGLSDQLPIPIAPGEASPNMEYQPTKGRSDPFPLRVAPGESIPITAWYRVTDCQAIEGIDRNDVTIDFQVRIADGPASWITAERTSDNRADGWSTDSQQQVSWAAGIAKRACKN